jgi:hypothetical protein
MAAQLPIFTGKQGLQGVLVLLGVQELPMEPTKDQTKKIP